MQQLQALVLVAAVLSQAPLALAAEFDAQNPRASESLANCIVDVGTSAIFLGKAGLGINAAVQTCENTAHFNHPTKNEQAQCSASVSGLISGLMYSASFAALAAADCQKSLKVTVKSGVSAMSPDTAKSIQQAGCVADVSFILAGMALIAQAGSQIYQVCPPPKGVGLDAPGVPQGTDSVKDWGILSTGGFTNSQGQNNLGLSDDSARRLSELSEKLGHNSLMDHTGKQLNDTKVIEVMEAASQKLQRLVPEAPGYSAEERRLAQSTQFKNMQLEEDRHFEEAQCAFDVGQATFFIARAGLMVNAAVRDCSKAELFDGANKGRAVCSVDVSSIIGAFSFVASGISYAVFKCPQWKSGTQAACAGSIINIVSALAEVAAAGSDFENSCGHKEEMRSGVAASDARRLKEGDSTVV